MRTTHKCLTLSGVAFALLFPSPVLRANDRATLYVANNAVDSPECGGFAAPCRSISQAIANAQPGDRLLVGPGRYGDVNGNGVLGEPGEEPAFSDRCFCMILVDKRLTIVSRDGVAATIIDVNGHIQAAVSIVTSGVVFGAPRGGFTLTGSQLGGGLLIDADDRVSVVGNLARRNGGADGVSVLRGTQHRVLGNVATENGHGFGAFATDTVFRDNVATQNLANGFRVFGRQNVFRGNRAIANGEWGFVLEVDEQLLVRNDVIANRVDGIFVAPGVTQIVVEKTNIYGNGLIEELPLNCGLRTGRGAAADARNNFWGSRNGPGADPADDACGGNVNVVPFAATEFRVPDAND
jgi:hypothetical protein